jgi:hypothetical protein
MQQDGASPHFRLEVRRWLNDVLPHRWNGRGAHSEQMGAFTFAPGTQEERNSSLLILRCHIAAECAVVKPP